MEPVKFNELLSKDFSLVRVEHELISELDEVRIGLNIDGYTTFKKVMAGLFMFNQNDMTLIFLEGNWYFK